MDSQAFIKKLDNIQDIPTLPDIALKVNKMLEDYDTSISQLGEVVEKDQGIVSKIMKLVNSTFFGLRSKVRNIPHAIVLLGFNTVRNAVVSVSIIDSFDKGKITEDFDIKDFWKHSISVAVTSRYLAEEAKVGSPDDCFIGGLLHDMGKVILVQHFPDVFNKIVASTKESKSSFFDVEKTECPFNHARIGGHLAKKWRLPEGLVDAIKGHHSVSTSATDFELLSIIHSADVIVNSHTNSSNGAALFNGIPAPINTVLNAAPKWYPDVSEEIESACEFFLEG